MPDRFDPLDPDQPYSPDGHGVRIGDDTGRIPRVEHDGERPVLVLDDPSPPPPSLGWLYRALAITLAVLIAIVLLAQQAH